MTTLLRTATTFSFGLILLCACGNRPPALPDVTPSPSPTLSPLPGASDTLSPTPNPFATTTLTPTASATPTLTASPTIDYSAPGVPSATRTPTLDYLKLAAHFLTPFTPWPTQTRGAVLPSAPPTANVPGILSNVVIRTVPPQPPPVEKTVYGSTAQDYAGWLAAFVQSATDLMNYTHGDRELYLQYIAGWVPAALHYSPDDWFLENDFDHDGRPEWLVAVPIPSSADGKFHCGDIMYFLCGRGFFLFEKTGNSYRPVYLQQSAEDKVALVQDLNNDRLPDIVFRSDTCGSACGTTLHIVDWDGRSWKTLGWISSQQAKVTFADLDGNGTVEISLEYSSGSANKYNYPYPFREGMVDVFGWRHGLFGLVNQLYPPTDSVFADIWDIDKALRSTNAPLALARANPILAGLGESCDQTKAFVGLQAMLAYALEADPQSMQATLARVEQYCDPATNAYVDIARILWAAYRRSHDPVAACQAMDRFRRSAYPYQPDQPNPAIFLNNPMIHIPDCPLQ